MQVLRAMLFLAGTVLFSTRALTYQEEDSLDSPGVCSSMYPPKSPHAPPLKDAKPIFYLHVPKCGTSFEIPLAKYACPNVPDVRRHMNELNELCPGSFSRFRFGHQPLSKLAQQGEAGHVVLMMRPPLNRIVSGYLHNFHDCMQMQARYGVDDHGPLRNPMRDEDDVLLEYAHCVKGCVARMLTGEWCDGDKGKHRSASVQTKQAMEALQVLESVTFVGMTESWNESMCLFEAMFGGNFTSSAFKNIRRTALTGRDWVEVLERNGFKDWADELLFNKARSMFLGWKSQYFA
ncbi:unnamed protein product [Choristocarpus tenellus]